MKELTPEQKKRLKKIKAQVEEASKKEQLFWGNEYPNLKFQEKLNLWSGQIHRECRWQGESTANEYEAFTERWFEACLKLDNDFARILSTVISMLSLNKKEVEKRINRKL